MECAACGATALAPHLSVAAEMGAQGLVPTTDRYGAALGDIVRCERCGHMQVDPMPAPETLAEEYARAASDAYIGEEAGQRVTARQALDRIERYTARSPRLLDVGCWVGFLLAEARQRGWQATGIEPSVFASGYARERLGLEVLTADLSSAPLEGRVFDAVAMADVIEHLRAPDEELAIVRELLAPGGLVWLAIPDAGSRVARVLGRRWWSVLPTHVQYFTRDSIAVLLERCGFEVLDVATAPKAFTVRYYLERIAGYSRPLSRLLTRAADAAGVADRICAPDFRDRISVIARRVP
jgi:SAM-dependent methyltransferase